MIRNMQEPSTIKRLDGILMSFNFTFDAATGHVRIAEGSTKIPDSAFEDRSDIISVAIPETVTSIGDSAFEGCALTTVDIPDSVTAIGNNAFHSNYYTEFIEIDPTFGYYVVEKLTSVDIGDSVKSIGDSAFARNSIDVIAIPDSITSIGEYAFHDNDIFNLVIPDSVSSIGYSAFTENALSEVTLPESFEANPPNESFDLGVPLKYRYKSSSEMEPISESISELYEGIIKSAKGRGKLKGTSAADAFTFDSYEIFTKKTADKIIGFDSKQGDSIVVTSNAFPSFKNNSNLKFASTNSKKELKQLSMQGYDIVYFEKKGRLYFDGNDTGKSWGDSDEGGLFAVLKGKPELTVEDFTLLT